MTALDRLLLEAQLDRIVSELGDEAAARLHYAKELRRYGHHQLAAQLEVELLELGGYTVTGRGPGTVGELLAGPAPSRAVWDWLHRLGERLGFRDEEPAEIW